MTDKDIILNALEALYDAFLLRHGCFPLDRGTADERMWRAAMFEAYVVLHTHGREKP